MERHVSDIFMFQDLTFYGNWGGGVGGGGGAYICQQVDIVLIKNWFKNKWQVQLAKNEGHLALNWK